MGARGCRWGMGLTAATTEVALLLVWEQHKCRQWLGWQWWQATSKRQGRRAQLGGSFLKVSVNWSTNSAPVQSLLLSQSGCVAVQQESGE